MTKEENFKIGIISDTHGLLRDEVIYHLQKCDYIIHGGDINNEDTLDKISQMGNLYVVRGNNDKGKWAESLEEDMYFTLGEFRFYLVHNKNAVPKNLNDVDVIIFGHSHKYFCEKIDDVLWLNPGSCGKRRFNLPVNMVIMKIKNKEVEIEKINIET